MTDQANQVPNTPTARMFTALGGMAMLSGFLVVLAYQITKPAIELNQRMAVEKMVFKVIPGATQRREFLATKDGVKPTGAGEGITIHAGYDDQGKLLGIAAKGAAQGYADLVHLLYAYDPACTCIRGIEVVKMAETPGLGDKIITSADFQANFKVLDAQLNETGSALAHEITTVKHGSKQHPWEIDAIAGATVTSKAVGKALNQSAQALMPLLKPHMALIERGATGEKAQ